MVDSRIYELWCSWRILMGRVINVHAAVSGRDTVVHSQRSVFLAHMKKPDFTVFLL